MVLNIINGNLWLVKCWQKSPRPIRASVLLVPFGPTPHTKAQFERLNRPAQLDNQLVIKGETYIILFLRETSLWNGVYVWVKPHDYSPLETDWETTLLGHKVELEWRLKVFPSTSNLFFLNFIAPRYAILFLNSKIYIVHVINHEWNRSMFVASAVCFVWYTKPDFPTLGSTKKKVLIN